MTCTKTMRYQIVRPLDDDWEVFRYILNQISYETWNCLNRCVQYLWEADNFKKIYYSKFGIKFNVKDVEGVTDDAYINRNLKKEFQKMNGDSVETITREVKGKMKKNKEDFMLGKSSFLSFKKGHPILFRGSQVKINKSNDNNYIVTVRLLRKEYAEELYNGITVKTKNKKEEKVYKRNINDMNIRFYIKANDKYNKVILERVLNKEYKIGGSRIFMKGNKIFFDLVYSFEQKKDEKLDKNRIMGIDIGYNIPAAVAINDMPYKKWFIGDRKEIEDFRTKIEVRKKQLQKWSVWAGDGRVGHGIKTRIKPVLEIGEKINNFKNLKNHCWSREIINIALRNKCGTIQMEKLEGIIPEEYSFLKNWSFYDLQKKIKYKAIEHGIDVVYIDPAYTSARCSKCGHIHRSYEKKEWRPEQGQFICQVCGYKENADINAARNIATPNIDKIIKEQLEKQEREQRNQKYVS